MDKSQITLITGATAGFGEAIAYRLAEEKQALIICGRRAERLEKLKVDLEEKFQVQVLPLCFDIQDREQVTKAIDSIPEHWRSVDNLINNAGLALGRSAIQDGDWDDWDTMIQTNVNGLLYVSRLILPVMKEKGSGHVINIGSTAGKETYAGGNVYSATKHAVNAISKSMRIDLLPFGVKVSQVSPGAANTEFSLVRYKGDIQSANKVYDGFQPLVAQDIARAVSFILNCPDHMCVNDMEITSTAQASASYLHRG